MNKYKVPSICIGSINIPTGKTHFDWSIYDTSFGDTAEIALTSNSRLIYGHGLVVGDTVSLVDNDSNRKISGCTGIKIVAVCKSNKIDVMKMLKENGFDYYPVRPFTKKASNNKLYSSYSMKGLINE